jgi:hypothetical protein
VKQAFTDLQKGIEIMDMIHYANNRITEIRKIFKYIEEDYFSLVGEEFGDLTVTEKAHRIEIISGAEHFIAAWKCHCTCGKDVSVNHVNLITKATTNCGGETHGVNQKEIT